tara:strand:+ start:964 stop:2100 length:1137 start_codon:yes stop_codon:yes gene_type:complete
MKIPFNKPAFIENSKNEILSSLESGNLSGRGPFTLKAEELLLQQNPKVSKILLSTSCTHALEASAILLDLKPGDEVIVPSYTFVTSALAFYMHGAAIRFCDVRKDTLNIDETLIEGLITKKTKAIVVVHYAGVSCEMDEIMKIAKKYNLKVIEDNAHGLFGKYKGNNLGSIGDLSTHSFHETKNFSCGEGGALFVRNKDFVERAEIIFEKGTNRSMFLNGQVDKYTWVDKGSSYIMSDILAALLYSQLLFYKKIQSKRELLWENYFDQLSNWSKVNEIQLPFVPNYCEQAFHMFYMLMPSNQVRTEFIKYLAKNNISSVFHYLPLDSSSMGASIRLDDQADCTISKEVSQCIVRLPLFFDLNLNDQEKVISTVTKFKV